MTDKTAHESPLPIPLYVLFCIAIGLCIWSFWIGTVFVRIWFYKGTLGEVPQKFIIVPHHRRRKELENAHASRASDGAGESRHTVFPAVAHLSQTPANPFSDEFAVEGEREWRISPKLTVPSLDDEHRDDVANEHEDPAQVRISSAEERRISRLPAFEQDDCGDGSEFPDVPYATNPIEQTAIQSRDPESTYRQLGLQKNSTDPWLTIDDSYLELHAARMSLLKRRQSDCIQVQREGESACEELMNLVVQHLCKRHQQHFTTKLKHGRKHVRNELAGEEYSLVRPYDCHPLGLCARLTVQDFCIWIRDEFTLEWYLQASATLFPSGWNLNRHIGKPLSSIIYNDSEPLSPWHHIPDILNLPYASKTTYTHSTLFIQTRPTTALSSLHLSRPADLFSGTAQHLTPQNLYVRREWQSFRRLVRSGAVVMTTRTEVCGLMEIEDVEEKRDLLEEIGKWTGEEAVFKGRELWIGVVEGWCLG